MSKWKNLNHASEADGPFKIKIGENGKPSRIAYSVGNEELYEYAGKNAEGRHCYRMPLGFFDTPETVYFKPLGRDPLPSEAAQ